MTVPGVAAAFRLDCWRRSVSCPRPLSTWPDRAGAAKATRQRQAKCQSRCSAHMSHTTRKPLCGRSSVLLLRHDGETSGVERRSSGSPGTGSPPAAQLLRADCVYMRAQKLPRMDLAHLGTCSSSAEEQLHHTAVPFSVVIVAPYLPSLFRVAMSALMR